MAAAAGVRLTAVVGSVVALLVFVLLFALGNFSGQLMGGKLPVPPAPIAAGVAFGLVALVGVPLTVVATLSARRPPNSRHASKGNKDVPVMRWADYPRERLEGDVL